ncbi:MAG: Eco57I restriction-modification methylase domain-containing protein [Candidatus ainarchaeum sp.]|nr:Eco57I restriction-modification methylase domain-containing protein [Candidatus ainarchaeum sp.]
MNEQQAKWLLDETFNSEFDILKFLNFLKELVKNSDLNIQDKTKFVEGEFRDYILKVEKLGQYKDKAGKSMEFLAIKLAKHSSLERARTMQRNFIAKWLVKNSDEPEGAIVAFYDDEKDWRFSFVKLEYNLIKDDKGNLKAKKELTPAKRYSYLVGPNEPNHTCKKQFVDLLSSDHDPLFEEIEKSFGIEKVTKEFFEEYKKRFLDLKESLEKVIKNNAVVKTEFVNVAGEENLEKYVVEFSKKLLGQIVFLYFLQKKGWLGVKKDDLGKFRDWGTGPKDFMKRLFNREYCSYNNFFNDVLEPLFYNTLAIKRNDDFSDKFDCKIPFLNGGLFEPLDGYDWMNTNIYIENSIFEDIFRTFDEFNFTVKEDEPLEKEVAVDPEMLGKVFENLLEVTDRRSIGAFYTPREIVHYMCQQSLINYLETNSSIPRTDIEKFIQEGDKYLDQTIKAQEHKKKYHGKVYGVDSEYVIPKSIEENYQLVDELLRTIKVVDPAVGSGAFPVGMMNEIVKARSILSVYFETDRDISEIKRECIENSLYGVDIMPSAVDICQLRFWLSLVVDEVDRKKIKPLPNLDNKIMCGNSLLEEFEGMKLFDDLLLGEEIKDIKPELDRIDKEINSLYLQIGQIETGKSKANKEELKKSIKKLEREKNKLTAKPEIKNTNLTLTNFDKVTRDEAKIKLNKLKAKQKEFFNSFDRDTKKQLKKEIEELEWELIEATLKQQGNDEAIKKLDSIMKSKSKPFFLWKLYFAEVFQRENPGFDVVIGNPPYIDYRKIDETTRTGLNNFEIYNTTKTGSIYVYFIELGMSVLRKNSILAYINPYQYLSADSGLGIRKLLVENYIIKRIVDVSHIKVFAEASTYTCINLFIKNNIDNNIEIVRCDNLNKLTKSGFLIEQKSVKEDNYRIPVTEENKIISKVSAISTKLIDFCNIFCGTSAGGFGKKIIKEKEFFSLSETKKEEYNLVIQSSNILKYVLKDLNSYIPKEIFPINVQNNFKKEKIFFARMTKKIRCTLVPQEYYGGKVNILTDFLINSKFLISILNSSLMSYWYYTKFESKHLSGGYLGFDIPSVKEIPIKQISPEKQKPFIQLVDQILLITKDEDYLKNLDKQAKVKRLEKEIDQLVYKLYELTPEEIKIVEEGIK